MSHSILNALISFALFRGLDVLRDGVSFGSQGLSMSDLSQPDVAIVPVYIFLICEWAIILALVYLFEKVGQHCLYAGCLYQLQQGDPIHLMKRLYLSLKHKKVFQPRLSGVSGSVAVSLAADEDQEGKCQRCHGF